MSWLLRLSMLLTLILLILRLIWVFNSLIWLFLTHWPKQMQKNKILSRALTVGTIKLPVTIGKR